MKILKFHTLLPSNVLCLLVFITLLHFRFQEQLSMPYMDSYEDWLRLYDIKPPIDYMLEDSIFSQIAIENSYNFGKINRRPHICGGFISYHQLLGPYVILTFNETNRQINSKILPGTATIRTNGTLRFSIFGFWIFSPTS